MDKITYSKKMQKLVKLAYGEDSKAFKSMMAGEDIARYLDTSTHTFSVEDILAISSIEELIELQEQAKSYKALKECYNLYLEEIYPLVSSTKLKEFKDDLEWVSQFFDYDV